MRAVRELLIAVDDFMVASKVRGEGDYIPHHGITHGLLKS